MQNLTNERYYRKSQKLILNHIELADEKLLDLWHELTPENAQSTYHKLNGILYPPIEYQNITLTYYYYVFIIMMLSIFISFVGFVIQSETLLWIAKGGLAFCFAFTYVIAAS